jgi:AraC-like DNA-binding protein
MTRYRMCTCAAGCALNSMADPGVFGYDCSCWCHAKSAGDPLLTALAKAQQRKEQADRDIRLLLAYAREHVTPRPYRLADLADAAGMSISGVRTAYSQADIDRAVQAIGADGQRHIEQAVMALLAQEERQAAPGHITAA